MHARRQVHTSVPHKSNQNKAHRLTDSASPIGRAIHAINKLNITGDGTGAIASLPGQWSQRNPLWRSRRGVYPPGSKILHHLTGSDLTREVEGKLIYSYPFHLVSMRRTSLSRCSFTL